MVASKNVFHDHTGGATAGQITLAFIHSELDWEERKSRVHPWCLEELEAEADGRLTHCEVCHKPFNPAEMEELKNQYEGEIYRPGEDVSKLVGLSDEEKSERRREIERIFQDPEAYEREQQRRYAEADEEAKGPVTIRVE